MGPMTNKWLGRILVIAQFALLIALVAFPQGELWIVDKALGGIAAAIIVLGLIISLSGIMGLGTSLTATPVPKEKAELKTAGIYALVRHPIYSGLLVMGIGVVLGGGSLWKIVLFLALLGLFEYKARFEEKLLLAAYSGYAEYAQKTGRFVPFVGKLKP